MVYQVEIGALEDWKVFSWVVTGAECCNYIQMERTASPKYTVESQGCSAATISGQE
jgi:hypothetical protein